MILLSHATGNENVRQAALALQEVDLLGEFWTCLSWNPEASINRLLPDRWRDQFARRTVPENVRPLVRTRRLREIARLFLGNPDIDAVIQDLDRRVARRLRESKKFASVYAYEDGAVESFRAASDCAVHRIYDLPIGYWKAAQQIYAEESEREPEWARTLTGIRDSAEKLARKEEELKLAECVVVASSFSRETLKHSDFAGAIRVIPYGSPEVISDDITTPPGKLRVLFAGSLGQRKGLSYLLRALDSLGDKVELTLLGRKTADNCAPLEAAIRKHRWIPTLPHGDLLREMQRHDVLVLPSLFEGFGLVILEAMAQGLVVIATPNTAAPDILDDGVDGFVVPIRSSEAIAEKLQQLAGDHVRLREMKIAARQKAQLHRWAHYRTALAQLARDVVS
jgi:glycosyltransferase involved in cell wall biosynthesis